MTLRALGDPDAVSVGDAHLSNVVAFALTGAARGTDERMLELLAPWAGHRARVVRLLERSGITPPRSARGSLRATSPATSAADESNPRRRRPSHTRGIVPRMPREMPKFEKSPPELVARFSAALERVATPDVTRRPMFGYPCAWINGNMVTGMFASQWWVRLSEPDREALLALPGAHQFEVVPGRAMGRYVSMPDCTRRRRRGARRLARKGPQSHQDAAAEAVGPARLP